MFVAFVPFSTALLGEYTDQQISVVIYGINIAAAGFWAAVQWWYATKDHRLIDPDLDPGFITIMSRRDIAQLTDQLIALTTRMQDLEIIEGKSHPSERNWALNILTLSNPEEIRKEILVPAEYITETGGKRRLAAAVPIDEGRYSIVKHNGHTELAYVLELPDIPGPAQKEFEIKRKPVISYR